MVFKLYVFFIKGEERVSEVTGKPEPYYSPWKRNFFRWKICSKLCLIQGKTVQILCHSPGYSSFSPDCLHLCLPHFGVPGWGETKQKSDYFNNFFSNGLTSWLWRRIISNSCATFQKFYWQSLFQYLMGFIIRLPCGWMIWVSL